MALIKGHFIDRIITLGVVYLITATFTDGAYFSMFGLQKPQKDPCVGEKNQAVRCVPDFVNAAFGKPVVASSTCGQDRPSTFCTVKEESGGVNGGVFREECRVCDSNRPGHQYPASMLTDLNNPQNVTCWISEPTTADFSSNVTLTMSLGKKFEVTYVSLQFCNHRPDSLAIYKSMDYGRTWLPFQFYSSQCKKIYGRVANAQISRHNEQEALCTDAHSATPLRGDRIAFATLEGRPSYFNFEQSPVLQVFSLNNYLFPFLPQFSMYGI